MKDSSSFSPVKLYPSSPRCVNWLRLRIKLCQRHQHCYCCVISVSVQNSGLCGLNVVTVFIHIPFRSSITEPCIKRSIEAKDLCREVFIIELFEIFNESLRPVQTKITIPLSAEFTQINPNFHLNCGLRCIAAVCVRLRWLFSWWDHACVTFPHPPGCNLLSIYLPFFYLFLSAISVNKCTYGWN